MKGLKCGLLLALFIMLGLSLSVSSDTNALKYGYDVFPIYTTTFSKCSTSECNQYSSYSSPGFAVTFDSSSAMSYDSDLDSHHWIPCQGVQADIWQPSFTSSRHQFSFSTGSDRFRMYFRNDPHRSCFPQQIDVTDYDGVYASVFNLSNGDVTKLIDLPNLFFDADDDGYDSGSIKRIRVPLSLANEDSSAFHISEGSPLEWDFGLVQKSANNFPYLDPNLKTQFVISYFSNNSDNYGSFWSSYHTSDEYTDNLPVCTVDTNYRFQTRSNELWQDYLGFNVSCTWTAPTDMYYVMPVLTIYGGDSINPTPFLSYDYHGLYFSGTFLTTDNDDTWSGEIVNKPISGTSIEDAPGYHQVYGYDNPTNSSCASGDWLCGLTTLFSFDFVNPFTPIFAMFSSNSSCASIPTLAGMLHSNETTVCPWFSSSVRSIVTPVLGVSSMMLIFGFVVHWLGARSGNFFEDSTDGNDVGSIHIGRKGKH